MRTLHLLAATAFISGIAACSVNKGGPTKEGSGGGADKADDGGESGGNGSGGAHTGGSSGSGGSGASGAAGKASGGAGDSGTDSSTGTGSGGDGGSRGPDGGSYVAPAGPLLVEFTSASDPAVPGGRLLYELTVSNVTARAIDGVSALLRVPKGIQFSSGGDAQPDSSTYCNGNGTCVADDEANWDLGTIAAGSSKTITVNGIVLSTVGDGDSMDASVTVKATGLQSIDVSKKVQVYSHPSAQLAISTPTNLVAPKDTFSFDVDVGQIGATALANAVLTVAIPSGLRVVGASDGGTVTAGQVKWTLGGVAVGRFLRRTIDVAVDGAVPPGALLTTRAELVHDGGLSVDDATEYTTTVVDTVPPLVVDTAVVSAPAVPGDLLEYVTTVSNVSGRAIDGVEFMMRVPKGIQFKSGINANPDSATYCSGNGNCVAEEEAVWDLGSLAAGSSKSITVQANVVAADAGDGNLIVNRGELTSTGFDTIHVMTSTPVESHPAAVMIVSASKDPIVVGEAFDIVTDIGQVGTSALAGSKLSLTLAPGLTAGAISDGGKLSGGTVSWDVGTVAIGAAARRTVSVTANSSVPAGAFLGSTAKLTYTGSSAFGKTASGGATVVADALPLDVSVVESPTPAPAGARLLYTANIKNTSGRAINDVAFTFRVPNGVEYNVSGDADPDGALYCNGNGTCTSGLEQVWHFASIAANATQKITVNAQVLSTVLDGTLVNGPIWVTASGIDQEIKRRPTLPAHH